MEEAGAVVCILQSKLSISDWCAWGVSFLVTRTNYIYIYFQMPFMNVLFDVLCVWFWLYCFEEVYIFLYGFEITWRNGMS